MQGHCPFSEKVILFQFWQYYLFFKSPFGCFYPGNTRSEAGPRETTFRWPLVLWVTLSSISPERLGRQVWLLIIYWSHRIISCNCPPWVNLGALGVWTTWCYQWVCFNGMGSQQGRAPLYDASKWGPLVRGSQHLNSKKAPLSRCRASPASAGSLPWWLPPIMAPPFHPLPSSLSVSI